MDRVRATRTGNAEYRYQHARRTPCEQPYQIRINKVVTGQAPAAGFTVRVWNADEDSGTSRTFHLPRHLARHHHQLVRSRSRTDYAFANDHRVNDDRANDRTNANRACGSSGADAPRHRQHPRRSRHRHPRRKPVPRELRVRAARREPKASALK